MNSPPSNTFFAFAFGCGRHLERVDITLTEIRNAVRAALAEDLGPGDATTLATVPAAARSVALMNAREPLVVAGLEFAVQAFRLLSPRIQIEKRVADGAHAQAGDPLLKISGASRALLSAERVALNFVQRLSGVATATAQYVAAVQGTAASILDTRKTTPGWRRFEKYAVTCGGGRNHRIGLYDMVLIKDNHLVALRHEPPNAIAAAVAARAPAIPQAARWRSRPTRWNRWRRPPTPARTSSCSTTCRPPSCGAAVKIIAGRAQTEASGGVNLKTVRAIAATGVDFISVGAITHSARAVDIGLDFGSNTR